MNQCSSIFKKEFHHRVLGKGLVHQMLRLLANARAQVVITQGWNLWKCLAKGIQASCHFHDKTPFTIFKQAKIFSSELIFNKHFAKTLVRVRVL